MADYLIQSETLDDIADAINAKTGGSSAMTPAEMVTAIGSISGGGGGFSLLASGSYTLASQGATVRIPVSFSGNPINVFVIYRGDGTGVAHTQAWAFMATLPTSELETLFDVSADRAPRSAISQAADGRYYHNPPIRARLESDNTIIDVRQTGSSYPCLAGQYDWYIYGEVSA